MIDRYCRKLRKRRNKISRYYHSGAYLLLLSYTISCIPLLINGVSMVNCVLYGVYFQDMSSALHWGMFLGNQLMNKRFNAYLKKTFQHPRPSSTDHGMPSFHAQGSTFAFIISAFGYPSSTLFGTSEYFYLSCSLWALICISRYHLQRHSLDQILVGVAIGGLLGSAPRHTLHSTPEAAICLGLEMAKVKATDVVYDIGCGDGRMLIYAAQKYQVHAVGIEIDPHRAEEAKAKVKAANLDHLITIHCGNALEFDFKDATIVFLFLIERGLRLILPHLEHKIRRPFRVLTYLYKFATLEPQDKQFAHLQHQTLPDVAFPVYLYHFNK